MKKRLILPVILLLSSAFPAFAQFAVIDHANLANAMLRHAALVRQLQQLQQTYYLTMQQYQMLKYQTQQIRNMARYHGNFSTWQLMNATNTYGNTGGWVAGVNDGIPTTIRSGYQQIAAQLKPFASTSQSQAAQQQRYGLVELNDGANMNSLDTLAGIRARDRADEQQIEQLEKDSLSPNPALNTQVAVLNKIDASNILMLRSIQETNKLLVSLLEQKTLESTRDRNHSAQEINSSVTAYQTYLQNAAALRGQSAGALLP